MSLANRPQRVRRARRSMTRQTRWIGHGGLDAKRPARMRDQLFYIDSVRL